MNIKKIITFFIMLAMIMVPFQALALEIPTIDVDHENVKITGNVNPKEDVNIIIQKANKRYFMDSIVANDDGDYTISTVLPSNMEFDVNLTSHNENLDFTVHTEKSNEETGSQNTNGQTDSQNTNGQTGASSVEQEVEKYITLSVDLRTIGRGYVIPRTKVKLKEDDTAWSVLKRELDNKNISYDYENNKQYNSVYVQSIDGEREFDHGSKSGWMYEVNGTYPGYGADKYRLEDGDVVKWRYTTNLGKDLGTSIVSGFTSSTEKNEIQIEKGDHPVINIPKDKDQNSVILFEKDDQNKESITINIPQTKSTVSLDLEKVENHIPNTYVYYDDKKVSLHILKETAIKKGKKKLEVFTKLNKNASLKNQVKTLLQDKETLSDITMAFKMGDDESVVFNQPLTLRFKDASNNHVAFIEKNKIHGIKIYENDEKGKEEHQNQSKYAYAYYDHKDLIVKTNHFTDYVTYITKQDETKQDEVIEDDTKLMYVDKNEISDWALESIKKATELGIINGDEENRFNPKNPITRAEFTTMIVKMLNLDMNHPNIITFKDVQPTDWFYPYVNIAYEENIIKGLSKDQFKPNEWITREQMAAIIVDALKIQKFSKDTSVKDLYEVSDWAKVYVSTVFNNNIMKGYNDEFNPKNQATREMAAVVCIKALQFKESSEKIQ